MAVVFSLLLGCGPMYAPPPAKNQPSKAGTPNAAGSTANESSAQLKGVDLWLYHTAPTAGVERKPTCWVHADAFTLESDNSWALDTAKAVIYAREANEPDIRIEARHGRFQESKMAHLSDGVKAKVGDMRIEMAEVQWLNDERVLQTDRPASIVTDDMQLDVETLSLYPDKRQIIMTRVTGTVELEGNQP